MKTFCHFAVSAGSLCALGLVAALALVPALGACDREATGTPLLVRANGELLQGAPDERRPQVASFKGIPFAVPPIDELRWQAPQPHKGRDGVQQAFEFAPACYQDSYNTDWYRRVGAAFGADASVFSEPAVSEDCLYLNVWTPRLDATASLPVMVWIYGGSNRAGWSYEPNYRGASLAARGNVVVVSIAYRVGVFGFFSHPELRGSSSPANFGLLDQVAALRWVRDNISAFGGNPGNVTVFGESAGAANIGYLVTSPVAAGLFHRAISQSGGFQMRYDYSLQEAELAGVTLSKALPGRPGLRELSQLDSATIFEAAKRASLGDEPFRPAVDGVVLLDPAAAAYRRDGLPYDLLVGSNQDEWYMYVDGDPAGLASELEGLPDPARRSLAALAARQPDVRHGHDKLTAFVEMVCPAYLMAQTAARTGRRAWVYRFTRVRPGAGGVKLLAYHGAEIPYVFDTHDTWLAGDHVDAALTGAMVTYWSNFARTGDPNGDGLPTWPAFDTGDPRVLELGPRIAPMEAPERALCIELAPSLYPGWAS